MKKSLILTAILGTLFCFCFFISINVYAVDGLIASSLYGDINADNKVNSTDYVTIKRYILGTIDSFPISNPLQVADLNGDKKITSTDIVLIKRYLLGIINEFPVSAVPIQTPAKATLKPTSMPSSNHAEATPTKPQATPTKPQATPTKPQATPTKPQTTPTKPQTTKPQAPATSALNTLMGTQIQDIQKQFGVHARKDLSKYGFYWYIYNQDYSKYIQVGIQNGKVVGIYSNSPNYNFFDTIRVGTAMSKVREVLGNPVQYIKKGDTMYAVDGSGRYEVYNVSDKYYATVFYDILDDSKVTSVLFINKETELSLKGYFGTPSEELSTSYENQIFDLTNSIRTRHGKPLYAWNETLAQTARNHSKDMALNSYFSSINLKDKSPYQRIKEAGISFTSSSENIGKGHMCGIFAFESWMNSSGQRQSILGNYKAVGVGVYLGQGKEAYYTQDFCTTK